MSPGDLIATSVQQRDGVVVVVVEGEVDINTASLLSAEIADVLAEEPAALIIDLSAVTFFASVGLRILVSSAEKMSSRGDFAVVASSAATRRPIELMRLNSMFPLCESLDAALTGVPRQTDGTG